MSREAYAFRLAFFVMWSKFFTFVNAHAMPK